MLEVIAKAFWLVVSCLDAVMFIGGCVVFFPPPPFLHKSSYKDQIYNFKFQQWQSLFSVSAKYKKLLQLVKEIQMSGRKIKLFLRIIA